MMVGRKTKQNRIVVFLFLLFITTGLVACQKEAPLPLAEIIKEPEEVEKEVEVMEEIIEIVKPEALSPFTGEDVGEGVASHRPFLVAIDNLKRALPQSGLSQADLYYEVLAEGGITRILALFQDFNGEKIGPVRSARDYFGQVALDNNAIFVHHGGSPSGYSFLKKNQVDRLDGMALDGSVFLRDPTRTGKRREHSSFVSAAGLIEMANKLKMDMNRVNESAFLFWEERTTPLSPQKATHVKIHFSGEMIGEFVFEEERYSRYEFNEPQIDEDLDLSLMVDNIIIQQTKVTHIKGDEAGRRQVDLIGQGEGYLITMGKYEPIAWSKESISSPTIWTHQSGEPLTLNKGKTWIAIVDTKTNIEWEGTEN